MQSLSRTTLITLLGIITFLLILSLPIVPASWAKPSAVKVMADEVSHNTPSKMKKGKMKNLKLKEKGSQGILSMKDEKKPSEYVSPVIQSDFPFTDAGIHWKEGNRNVQGSSEEDWLHFQVRTSKDNKKWSKWETVEADPNEWRDNQETSELFSNLIVADHANYLQYKTTFRPGTDTDAALQNIQVTFLNSEDGEKVAAKGSVSLGSLVTDKAMAAIGRPPVVSRAEWGADESLRYIDGEEDWPREYVSNVTHMIVHHTDSPNDDPDPAARVRSIYYYHAKTRGYGDIGYNAIVGSDGRIYEGRKGKDGDVLTPGVVGGHAYSFNYGTFGISLMGDYSQKELPADMHKALIDMLSYQADLHGIDPTAKQDFVRNYEYDNPDIPKTDPDLETLTGHGLLPRASTTCPGDYVRNNLPSIRTEVSKRLATDDGSIVLDNMDSAHVAEGDWVKSTNVSGYYGSNYQANDEAVFGIDPDTFTWNFNLPEAATYQVSVYYTAASDRATNAPYIIHTKNGEVTKTVNQQENGGQWVDIGTYEFNAGANKIVQTDDADGYVIADGIKLKKLDSNPQPSKVIVDNEDTGSTSYVGTWPKSTSVSGYYGANYQPNGQGTGSASFTWNFSPPETGIYRVSVRYTSASDRASDAPYTVTYANGSYTHDVNQRSGGGNWVELGVYPFEQGKAAQVKLTDDANGYVIADAVQFEKVDGMKVIDNNDASATHTGTWKSSTAQKTFYGSNYLYNYKGTGADTFTWNLNAPETGSYKIYARWQPYTDRATNAPFTIHHKSGQSVKKMDQRDYSKKGQWMELGTYNFDAGTGKVVLSDNADGIVVADAILMERVPDQIVSDNADTGNEGIGAWKNSSNLPGYEGTNYQYDYKGTGDHTFTWNFEVAKAGSYKVYAKYLSYTDRATNAPYTIHHRDGQSVKRVNQRSGGGEWVELGTYNFDAGPGKVVLSDDADGIVVADAIKLEPAPVTVTSDNTDTGNEGIGAWKTSSNLPGYEGTNYQYDYKGTGDHTFTWNLSIPEAGSYKVYVKYLSYTDRATNAPYTVYHQDGQSVKEVNQRSGGGQWTYLGTWNFAQGAGSKVVLSDNADGIVVADSVKLVKE
ncbi:golvesin C-terminal-like domain-containing protein [Salinithrix halophila]|uniref:N-acetylmuramoyl-L-alanine amidase n=1 Tax=Salinithrix halophila TaxID=1485204 RepID=A0ABV8JF96_9BACL